MQTGKRLRMRRFFKRGRALIVPMDHALYSGPVKGIEDMIGLVSMISKTEADGILVTPGILKHLEKVIGDLSVVLRIDGTHTKLGSHLERIDLITTVEHALKIGADMVVVNVFVGVENEDRLLAKLGSVATACREYGIPLMAEMIPNSILTHHYAKGGKEKDNNRITEDIKLVSRLGAEIGADVIKTHYSGTIDGFKQITAATPVPIVIAGGPKANGDKGFLQQVKDAITAGAEGICIGRNVWQHTKTRKMLKALSAIVHDEMKVDESMRLLK